MVTAKHNIEQSFPQQLYVSVNPAFEDQSEEPVWIPLPTNLVWHDNINDQKADVVVADWRPERGEAQYHGILLTQFLEFLPVSKEIVGAGSDTKTVGLFPFFSSRTRHRPVVKSGAIALYPPDVVRGAKFEMEALLVESRSIGGLSGSPVFAADIRFGKIWYPFIGLTHGHWDFKSADEAEPAANSGMSIVSPGQKVIDILFHEDVVSGRKEFDCLSLEELASGCDSSYGLVDTLN
ncbi:MAG: hypothetical protein ACRES7_09900 [Gammaproteobacteria bacterium]